MGQKYSKTTADYLEWSVAMNLIRKLQKDGNHRMSLFIAIGVFTGLRVSDILGLRWEQILIDGEFTIIEKKTEKHRTIRLNPQIQEHIKECYEKLESPNLQQHILISRLGTVYTIQSLNRLLKQIRTRYKLKIRHFSCHSLRKTFGRQVYNLNRDNAEMALLKLMELFNHSSVAITKRYLGIRQEELLSTYDMLDF